MTSKHGSSLDGILNGWRYLGMRIVYRYVITKFFSREDKSKSSHFDTQPALIRATQNLSSKRLLLRRQRCSKHILEAMVDIDSHLHQLGVGEERCNILYCLGGAIHLYLVNVDLDWEGCSKVLPWDFGST
ncbi:hypothetical protein RRG08_042695 [Elysia crispata]|uniref:Uncharacterized protein n=1 Tax=Elysia crispata TaxID=231223 RepID=A0AAE0XQZ7_9GAST|nr:hypothetical protein RRG08_042695 [Elysia crispata]